MSAAWSEKSDDSQMQYYVLVLEAGLAFSGGMTIPLMSEFLSYTQGDTDTKKQDCEQVRRSCVQM